MASASIPTRSTIMPSKPPGMTPTKNSPGSSPLLKRMRDATRYEHHRPNRRLIDLVGDLKFEVAFQDIEELIFAWMDVQQRPALRCDDLF